MAGTAAAAAAARRQPIDADSRYATLLDAFLTADRRRRGHLPYQRTLDIYTLYFHASADTVTSSVQRSGDFERVLVERGEEVVHAAELRLGGGGALLLARHEARWSEQS